MFLAILPLMYCIALPHIYAFFTSEVQFGMSFVFDAGLYKYTVKKGYRFSRPKPECHQTLSWRGII